MRGIAFAEGVGSVAGIGGISAAPEAFAQQIAVAGGRDWPIRSFSPGHRTMDGTNTAPTATATLDSLAREFQQLPVASLAPAIVLVLSGLILLIAGRHFLRPVMVVTTILFGAMLGPSILGGIFPRLGAVPLAFIGGLAGLVFVAIAWRLVLGAAMGVIAAFACALLAMLAVDAGFIDARSPGDPAQGVLSAEDAEVHRAIVDHAPRLIHPLVDWADRRWLAEPQQVRTLLGAAAAGGGFIGLVLGAWLTQSSSALLTSMVGAIFTLVGALPFAARHFDRVAEGPRPVGWLLLWLALALAGWLFQTRKGENHPREPGEPSLRRRRTPATGGR